MRVNQEIYDEMMRNNKMITTSQVLALGFSKQLLSKYVTLGILERISHGLYQLPNEVSDDMYTLMLKSDNIVFSHDTALFLNGLSDRTPFLHVITVPSNTSISKSMKKECVCFYVKPKLHKIGITTRKTTMGNTVYCYNIERTLCDLLRSRNRCDEETVISAIKNYAECAEKDLNRLFVYAQLFHVEKVIRNYLEVLL